MMMILRGRLVMMVVLMSLAMVRTGWAAEFHSFITMPGEAKRAVEAILAEIGAAPKVFSIRIEDNAVTIQVQGTARPSDVDEWRFTSKNLFAFNFERTSGPKPVRPASFVNDVTAGFFDISTVAIDRVSDVVNAAVARAALEDVARVSAIEIARQISILPNPSFGNVQWSISLGTGRESATVYAAPDGTIIGGDLSQTNRARTLDLITTDDWPQDQAIRDLTAVVGEARRIREVTVYNQHIGIVVDHPTAVEKTQDYSWNLSGVTTMGILTPKFPGIGDGGLFSMADLDLKSLGKIRAATLQAWGNPEARIVYFMLKRDMRSTGAPELRWIVALNDPNGEDGSVELATTGEVRSLDLPDSRKPKIDWMAPETLIETIGRIDREFTNDARFTEIMHQAGHASILVEDSQAAGTNAEFLASPEEIARSGTPMPWDAELRPEYTFRIADLGYFTPQHLHELLAQTYKRLGTDPLKMPLSRYTFSVGQLRTPDGSYMVPSLDGKVTLEIRVEAANRMDGGWVTYSSTGEAIDVMTP